MYMIKKTFGKVFKHNLCGCTAVSEGTVGLKRQFGRHLGRMDPGCHCVPWCLGYTVGGFVSSRTRQAEVRSSCLTSDSVPIEFRALLTWTLAGNEVPAAELLFPTRCESKLVSKIALQSICRHVGRTTLDDLLAGVAWLNAAAIAVVTANAASAAANEAAANAPPEAAAAANALAVVANAAAAAANAANVGDAAAANAALMNSIKTEMQAVLCLHGISLVDVFIFDIIPNAMLSNSYTELSAAGPTAKRADLMMRGAKTIYNGFSVPEIGNILTRKEYFDKLKNVVSSSETASLFIGAEGIGQPKKANATSKLV